MFNHCILLVEPKVYCRRRYQLSAIAALTGVFTVYQKLTGQHPAQKTRFIISTGVEKVGVYACFFVSFPYIPCDLSKLLTVDEN